MTKAVFYQKNGAFFGFKIQEHSGYAKHGSDVVCAAVSSAVQLTVNLLDEFGCEPSVKVGNAVVECKAEADEVTADRIVKRLKEHFESVREEFPKNLNITISEV